MADFYAILGISHAAESDEIAKAYRRAALTFNPDCNPDATNVVELRRRFTLVSQAYVVLSNPKTRAIYDAYAESGVRHGGTFSHNEGLDIDAIDPDTTFRQFFGVDNPFQIIGDATGLHSTQHHFYSEVAGSAATLPPAEPVMTSVVVSLEEAFGGTTTTASWTASNTTVRGDSEAVTASCDVTVPKGIQHGATIKIPGVGHKKEGHSQGPVHVRVEIAQHDRFTRDGDNLIVVVPITIADALTGCNVEVSTIDGRVLNVLIDEIVHPQFALTIAGQGMTRQAGGRGDLIVRCSTQFPEYLSAEQKREVRRILS